MRVSEDLQQAVAGAERVYSILDTDPDIKDSPGAREIKRAEGKITFDRVYFHYVENIPVLTDVSFTAQAGQMVALVGPTGVGKTTIISLIARFYDPVSGNIYLDGHNLKDITLSSLRNQISIVLQDVFLFHGTVAENIAYGVKNAGQEEIARAAKIARAHDFICKLPEGYQTVIGERGVKLSGGPRAPGHCQSGSPQSPILILDEATATSMKRKRKYSRHAGDGRQDNHRHSHRLSTIKRANQILVRKTAG